MTKEERKNISKFITVDPQVEELDVWEYRVASDGTVKIKQLHAKVRDYGYRTETHLFDMQGEPYHDIYIAGTIFDRSLRKQGRFYFKDNSDENLETLRTLYLERAEEMERKARAIKTTAEQMHIVQ